MEDLWIIQNSASWKCDWHLARGAKKFEEAKNDWAQWFSRFSNTRWFDFSTQMIAIILNPWNKVWYFFFSNKVIYIQSNMLNIIEYQN